MRLRWAAGLVLSLSSIQAADASQPYSDGRLNLGVTVHFGQNWPDRYWPLLEGLPAPIVREAVSWKQIEAQPGEYRFTEANSGHINRLCGIGRRVVLTLLPVHPAHDNGETAYSSAARTAFAHYVRAVADRFGDCLAGIQIGNEINGARNMIGAAAKDRARAYTALLEALYPAVKQAHPDVLILGGSTNAIGIGFLEELFDAGALDVMDGVVVHPYRQDPANVDWELERLKAAMAARGAVKPIWANEFSRKFEDPAEGAPYLAKMATLMNAAGVEQAIWYAMVDQPGFPTMGLYTKAGEVKPAGQAFLYFATEILSRGRAVRIDAEDETIFHYRFGPDRQIIWGAPRGLQVEGEAVFRDASGAIIPRPTSVSDEPVIVEGDAELHLGPRRVLADSFYGYGRAPWSYFGQRGNRPPVALAPTHWKFTTFIGHPTLKPATVNQRGILPAGKDDKAIRLTLRYTADRAGPVFASACFDKTNPRGDGVAFGLLRNGVGIDEQVLGEGQSAINVPLSLARGDTVDFTFAPNATPQADLTRYRLRVATRSEDAATC